MELESSVEVVNKHGLHARASTRLAQVAQQFECAVFVGRDGDGDEGDAKSILGILTLGIEKGQMLKLRTSGDDAKDAMNALVMLIEDKFGEE